MTMSIFPNSSLTFLKTSLTCSRLVTSILMASDFRPILRISSAVALEWTHPCEMATWASTLPWASAVFCSSGSSSTRTSVITTSAPARARVSASWRPRPREAPVMTATLPLRSNIFPSSRYAPLPDPDRRTRAGDGARDDQSLDLGGAFPDLVDLRVAEPFLDRVLLDVSVSAEHLDGVGGHIHGNVCREAFGHRALSSLERLARRCRRLARLPGGGRAGCDSRPGSPARSGSRARRAFSPCGPSSARARPWAPGTMRSLPALCSGRCLRR